ncbi:MAG: hypothetical protein ACM31C_02005 [Acidobacteriota bacterium]
MKTVVIALLLAACGGGHGKPMPDTPPQPMPDAMPDAPPQPATLTSYVIDLVQHQTADDTAPKPYSEFSALPDPDTMNGSAYAPLFP